MSTRQRTLKTSLVVFALLLGAASAFALNSAFLGTGSANSAPPVERSITIVDTLEEADETAGYKVRVPTYIPAGFEFDSKFQVADHPLKAQAKSVFQSWSRASDGAFFLVEQSPTLKGLIEQGEQSTVRGITGEKVLHAADAERPFGMVAFYWAEEDRGILVLGSLKSGIEESEIKSVAESIQVRR